jgi:hypothetical protein
VSLKSNGNSYGTAPAVTSERRAINFDLCIPNLVKIYD